MAKVGPAIAAVYRGGVVVLAARASSATIRSALDEAMESDLIVTGEDGLLILSTDSIRVLIGDTEHGPYTISTLTRSMAEGRVSTQLTLAGCGSILRDIPTVDDDPFVALDNVTALEKVAKYVAQESGTAFPVTFVNAETVLMGAEFSVRASTALDMMRSIVGATGNSLRFTPGCGIEVGRFAGASGLLFTNSVKETRGSVIACTLTNYHVDTSDVYGWLFVEGGSFAKGTDRSVNLTLGSRDVTVFSVTPPAGFKITEVEAGTRLHYKLMKTGSTVKRGKRIQIAGITPSKENDLASEIEAATLLAKSAALYLSAKSEPEIAVDVTAYGTVDMQVGDKADIFVTSSVGDVVDENLYAKSIDITADGDLITTSISFSNRLGDPEELINAAKTVKAGATGRKPKQLVGSTQGTTISVSPASSLDSCGGSSKQVYVDYHYANFEDVPTVSIEADPGITMTVSSVSMVEAVLCFYKTTVWTGTEVVRVILAGPRSV